MNKPGRWSALLSGLLLASVSGVSVADRGHGRHGGHADVGVGIVVNPFWYDSWPGSYYYSPYYYPPYYYPPAVVTVPATPPVYIEREDDSAAAPGTSYWYYCADPQGYYPDVKECPGGWRAVSPQPDGEER